MFDRSTALPAPSRAPTVLRIALFLLIYGVLHWAYQSLRASAWDGAFIHVLTAQPAAALIGVAFPLDAVTAVGPRLVWPGGRLTLLAGCDGFEVMSLFVAAMLVANVSWRRGLLALLAGCVAVWGLNQIRIATLYWSFRYERDWFDAIHTAWGPLVLICAVALMYAWATRTERGARRVAASAAPAVRSAALSDASNAHTPAP